MLRIIVCAAKMDIAQHLYKKSYELIKAMGAKCELSYSVDANSLLQNTKSKAKLYDIYLLDCNDQQCINLATYIRNINLIPSIIFCGENAENLQSLIKLRPSYIISLKENEHLLGEALKWCCNEQIRSRTYFNVKNKDVQMRIDYNTISYFESRQRIVAMYTTQQVIEFYAKLGDVYSRLPNDTFVRCHQSYIVNMSRVRQLDKANRLFIMLSGRTIEISKSHYKDVVDEYEKFVTSN